MQPFLILLAILLIPVAIGFLSHIFESLFKAIFCVIGVAISLAVVIMLIAFLPWGIILPILVVVATIGLSVAGIMLGEDHPLINAIAPVALLAFAIIGFYNGLTLWVVIPATIMASYMIAFRPWEEADSIIEYFEYGYERDDGIWEVLSSGFNVIDLGIPGLILNLVIYTGVPILGLLIGMPEIAFFPLGFAVIRMIIHIIRIVGGGY